LFFFQVVQKDQLQEGAVPVSMSLHLPTIPRQATRQCFIGCITFGRQSRRIQ